MRVTMSCRYCIAFEVMLLFLFFIYERKVFRSSTILRRTEEMEEIDRYVLTEIYEVFRDYGQIKTNE